jgi:hypothetical protein
VALDLSLRFLRRELELNGVFGPHAVVRRESGTFEDRTLLLVIQAVRPEQPRQLLARRATTSKLVRLVRLDRARTYP